MIASPGVGNFFRLRCVHKSVLSNIVSIQNIVKLGRHIMCHNVVLACSVLDFLNEVQLCFSVCFFLLMLGLDCFLEDLISMLHWEPLEASHEFVHNFADFVPISDTSSKYFDIVLSKQTLRLEVDILYIKTTLTEISLRVWPILRYGLIIEIILLQSLTSIHSLLNTVLDLAV